MSSVTQLMTGKTLVLMGSLDFLGDTVGDSVDVAAYQSVSVQVAGSFVGTATFQVSNDGVNWLSKALNVAAGSAGGSVTSAQLVAGDIGARYFRVTFTAYTSGSAAVTILFMPESQAPVINPAQGTQAVSGTVGATPAGASEQAESSTNLAANATYTGTARDLGTTAATRATMIRPVILHTAGNDHGQLLVDESTDGTTWRQTRQVPVPSDTSYRTFEFPVHMRYYRLRFVNGPTAQTAFYLHTSRVQGEGGTIDSQANLSFLMSTAALAAGGTYTGRTLDLGDNHSWNVVRARVNLGTASSTVTVQLQSSHDGTIWATSPAGTATTTTAGITAIERPITERYIRLVVTNGATAQASNQMTLALVSL